MTNQNFQNLEREELELFYQPLNLGYINEELCVKNPIQGTYETFEEWVKKIKKIREKLDAEHSD